MSESSIKTVDEAIKILAYNDWAWNVHDERLGNDKLAHPKDKSVVLSLAEPRYPWTEKQAKLALGIVKRYATKFESYGIEIRTLINNPVYEHPFRIIHSEKIIELSEDHEGNPTILMKFPYNEKIVFLLRCCKEKRNLPAGYFHFDGETKIWTVQKSDVTTYYMTMIAARYNFAFDSEQLLNEFEDIKKEKINFKKNYATIEDNKIKLHHVSEQLQTYWQNNIRDKKLIVQLDQLKHVGVSQKKLRVKSYSEVGRKIAHNTNRQLWVDKNTYTKDEIILGLQELDAFPILMPVSGAITDSYDDIVDFAEWIKCFERHGIDRYKDLAWGFELKEPKEYKDMNEDERFMNRINFDSKKLDKETFDKAYDLYQESRQFRNIDQNTKVYFIRNRIPRTLMRSELKFKCSIVALGGGYYATGGENIKRLLDNIPKKLYYSNAKPMSYEWQSRAIIKL